MNIRLTVSLLSVTLGLLAGSVHAEPVRDSRLLKKTSLKAGEVKFLDVVKELSTRHKTPIEVHPNYLEIFPDDSLTIHQPVDGITLQSALSLVVGVFDGEFVVERGKVTIGLLEDLAENHVDVDYPLTSLGPLAAESTQMTDVIQYCSEGLWKEVDGDGGEILGINARAVRIRQTIYTHYEIAELLQTLAAATRGTKRRGTTIDKTNDRVVKSCTRVIAPTEATMPLAEALELLLAKNRVPYWLDLDELEAAGIDSKAEVEIENSKQPVGIHLAQILDRLKLAATVKHEVVFITTKEIAEESRISVAYNVSRHVSANVTMEDIYNRVTMIAGTGPWVETDGTGGTGLPLGPLLVIHHNRRAHQLIGQALGSP